MDYIAIDDAAVDEIVSNRFLQSIEFDQGRAIVALLRGQARSIVMPPAIIINWHDKGLFMTGRTLQSSSKFVVIDEEQSGVFRNQTDQEAIFTFQKTLRFAKKLWQGLSLTFSERVFSGSSKAILFPYRYRPAPYRVVMDRSPMGDRLEKRGQKGNWLLVYKAGHEGGTAGGDDPELTNFRKAFEAVGSVKAALGKLEAEAAAAVHAPAGELEVLQLAETQGFGTGSMFRGYEDWLPLLTTQQQRFVTGPICRPCRIEGAAGTGKTLSLILKAVHALRSARARDEDFHAVLVTHSDATKRTIAEVMSVVDGQHFTGQDRFLTRQSINIRTLSELCADVLRQSISESEFIDRDAMESKELQLLYISIALDRAIKEDLPGHARFLTSEFLNFISGSDLWSIVEMLQHEISVIIKGRASEKLDKYKEIKPIKYGIPVGSEADKGFIFTIFRLYQDQLREAGQFDTDDVVLTAIGQLDTPIWRRRRTRDGYDAVLIDETHLFNINELHLFHYFTKRMGPYPIIYTVDRSQAVGDRGWSTEDISTTLANKETDSSELAAEQVRTVFRSSPEIVNLAFSIVSSGATLFTNFDNPLVAASSGFTEAEERICSDPVYISVPNEESLVEMAFARAEVLHNELNCRRSDVLIVTLSGELLKRIHDFSLERNKPVLVLKERGDTRAVEAARASGQFVLAHADYVGGLEFSAVILVGIDGGRVPPDQEGEDGTSRTFLSYVSHNRLYVAVSRARYRVEILGEKARGPSKLIQPAISSNIIVEAPHVE